MDETKVRLPDDFESTLRTYASERAEEGRAVRVGEKERSEAAAIVARYADLFTREQLDALRGAEEAAGDPVERERLHRLRKSCEGGLLARELVHMQDEVQNELLAIRIEYRGEEMPLRNAQAKLALLDSFDEREELGEIHADATATMNERRLEVARAAEKMRTELTGIEDPVERSEDDKGISLRQLAEVLPDGSALVEDVYTQMRERWLDAILGADRPSNPSSYHAAYVRRLSPLKDIYSKERATDVCLATLSELGFDLAADENIRTDLEDRPQKTPRPCVIPSDPPTVVHLITRPQGGLPDYQGFLHEAGHALHYAGCDPDLPYTFRALSRDHALTEIYSFLIESITREPGWHERHFDLSAEQAAENAEATLFLHAFLFRRYVAKFLFELDFWSRFPEDGGTSEGYAERLTEATGYVYRSDGFVADMDAGFYSADYLRAWIRSAQVRAYLLAEVGADWWHNPTTGDLLRKLFWEGTQPSSEEVAGRLGFNPVDLRPLVSELKGSTETLGAAL
ncbi:MAG TPA: hypothetical protein VFR32_01860 [Gaiellaceae bacterium]|nr:hypothetical protein [Gaiellaceae bacterium]